MADLTLEAVWAHVEGLEDRVRHLETRVRELEEAGSEFRLALNRLGDALASTHDLPVMLRAVVETCALYLRASGAVFYGLVAGTDKLRPLATTGAEAGADLSPLGELRLGQGLAGTAAGTDAVVLWPDRSDCRPSGTELVIALGARPHSPMTAVAVPVKSGGHGFGVLALYGRTIDSPFSDDDVDSLATLARQVETAIDASFHYREATRLSITDGLTGLWNRRQFDLRLTTELQRGVRFRDPFSVVLLDLDQMKPVNDLLGHQAGDALLVEMAQRLSGAIRDVDLVARIGGDEFGLILPNTGVAGALRLAEKVRSALGDEPVIFEGGPGEPLAVTGSFGVASYPEHGKTGRDLVAAADAALYRAKAGGGNRVEHAKVGR